MDSKIDYYAIDSAAFEIGEFISRWGFIRVSQTKEKYGTARVYCSFGFDMLHSVLFPMRNYKHPKYPNWLWSLDIFYISKLIVFLSPLIYPYQKYIYKLGYKRAIEKYPHIRRNILSGADWPELLEDL